MEQRRAITTLPEKWAVKVTDKNRHLFINWADTIVHDITLTKYWDENKSGWNDNWPDTSLFEDRLILTTDEFCALVLKTKRLVGFKAPFDFNSVKKGEVFIKEENRYALRWPSGQLNSLRSVEEVERWEAVYEDVEKPKEKFTFNGIQDFPDTIESLRFCANSLLNQAQSKEGHLADEICGINTIQSILEIHKNKIKEAWAKQKGL